MADIDELLSETLQRLARPGDSAGVADVIRARVAAGDPGTPSATSGFRPTGGPLSWLPWVGLVVVAGTVGGALGATGVFGVPPAPAPVSAKVLTAVLVDGFVDGLDCPGGSPTSLLQPGQHVLALSRSDDSGYIAVRDPASLADAVWLPSSALRSLGAEFATLPVAGCGIVTLETPTPTPTPTPTVPAPGKPPSKPPVQPPPPPSDTAPPSLGPVSATPTTIYNSDTATIHATASDNVGVTSVQISWTGSLSGSGTMTKVGGEWRYAFSSNAGAPASYGTITFTMVAHDAAGNSSAPASVSITRSFFG